MPPLTDGSGAEGARDDEHLSGPEPDAAAPAEAQSAGPEVAPTESETAHEPQPGVEPGAGSHADPEVRRHPSTIGGAFYLVVLAATVVGLVIVGLGRWRTGVHWMGGALVVAGALRGLLPSRDAGMLAVRHRWFDAVLLAGTGVALWILATSIPDA